VSRPRLRVADPRGWAALGACLTLAAALTIVDAQVAKATADREVRARVGQVVPVRGYAARLDAITLAREVVVTGAAGSQVLRTTGPDAVFVVSTWSAAGATGPVELWPVTLVAADGRSFAGRAVGREPRLLQPGERWTWASLVELPVDGVAGARLRLAAPEWVVPLYDHVVLVDVGDPPADGPVERLEVVADRVTLGGLP